VYPWDLRVLLRLKPAEVDVAAVELAALFETTNPAELTRKITAMQTCRIALAKDNTNAVAANGSRATPAEARDQLSRAS